MPRDGNGIFNLIYSWIDDRANDIDVDADRMQDQQLDIATALSNSIVKDGQTPFTSNQSMGNHRLTNLQNPTDSKDAAPTDKIQDGSFFHIGTTLGSADSYIAGTTPAFSAYLSSMSFTGMIHATNLTTTPTLQLNGIGTPTSDAVIKKISLAGLEVPLEVGDLVAGKTCQFQRNVVNNAWLLMNPSVPIYTPAGSILRFAGNTSPLGFAACDGSELPISTYGELSSAIYVGDANNADTDILFGFKTDGAGNRSITGTHIKIPDTRGEFSRGWDNGRGIDTGRVFGSGQLDAFQNIAGPVGNGRGFAGIASSGLFTGSAGTGSPAGTASTPSAVYRIDFDTANDPSLRTAVETRPRNIAFLDIIKF